MLLAPLGCMCVCVCGGGGAANVPSNSDLQKLHQYSIDKTSKTQAFVCGWVGHTEEMTKHCVFFSLT